MSRIELIYRTIFNLQISIVGKFRKKLVQISSCLNEIVYFYPDNQELCDLSKKLYKKIEKLNIDMINDSKLKSPSQMVEYVYSTFSEILSPNSIYAKIMDAVKKVWDEEEKIEDFPMKRIVECGLTFKDKNQLNECFSFLSNNLDDETKIVKYFDENIQCCLDPPGQKIPMDVMQYCWKKLALYNIFAYIVRLRNLKAEFQVDSSKIAQNQKEIDRMLNEKRNAGMNSNELMMRNLQDQNNKLKDQIRQLQREISRLKQEKSQDAQEIRNLKKINSKLLKEKEAAESRDQSAINQVFETNRNVQGNILSILFP